MAATLLEGKTIAKEIKEVLSKEVENFKTRPVLVTIQVGKDEASGLYIKSQEKLAKELGIGFESLQLKDDIKEDVLIDNIKRLNNDDRVNAILLQLPLPKDINPKRITGYINPKKDAEGMHPENLGRLLFDRAKIAPCTAMAVMELIGSTKVDLYGKEAVIVGHSEIVGKPVSLMLLDKFATVTTCHIATSERGSLASHVKRAEVLVVAVGKPNLIKGEWIKDGAIVIDVGINKLNDKIVGDVEFEEAQTKAAFITPVPGGVGPLTVTMLMRNVVEAYKIQKNFSNQVRSEKSV